MGFFSFHGGKITRWRRRRKMGLVENHTASATSHDGIRTIRTNSCCCGFTRDPDLCIKIITWNMNGKVFDKDLKELIGRSKNFDLLVVGLQEVPRTKILHKFQSALDETHTLLGKAMMQSLQLFVFGPKSSAPEMSIKEAKVDKHGVSGCGGLIRRKKGAVAVTLNYSRIKMVFISCHLAAHARNVEERNTQFRHISHSVFSKNKNPYARPADIIVWLGDLNYRIQGIDTHPARNLIQQDLHGLLTSKDQLLQEAERGQIFNGYTEGALSFKPTYKYNVGTSDYDTSHKVRVPSWTDRILFKVEDSDYINAALHSYESVDSIFSSDHKPVKAHLCLKINRTAFRPCK